MKWRSGGGGGDDVRRHERGSLCRLHRLTLSAASFPHYFVRITFVSMAHKTLERHLKRKINRTNDTKMKPFSIPFG